MRDLRAAVEFESRAAAVEPARVQLSAPRSAALELTAAPAHTPQETSERIQRYYEGAGRDYEAWSGEYNMHFGFWRPGVNPFSLRALLDETNRQVLERVISDSTRRVLDLGCGLGATMRSGSPRFPAVAFSGVTLVPWQVEEGRKLAAKEGCRNVAFHQADYLALPFENGSADGCYAIESAVHAPGSDKRLLFREMSRVLAPGGRFAVFDCFLKQPAEEMLPWTRRAYREACAGWAVKEMGLIGEVRNALTEEGLQVAECTDISYRVAPSVAHVPWVTAKFLAGKLFRGEQMGEITKRHVMSCALAVALGLARPSFSYYLISGHKA